MRWLRSRSRRRDRGWVFLGKATANLLILGAVQALVALVFALVFDVPTGGRSRRRSRA